MGIEKEVGGFADEKVDVKRIEMKWRWMEREEGKLPGGGRGCEI